MLRLQQRHLDVLRNLAENAYPEEFCALLLGSDIGRDSAVDAVLPCQNQAQNPRRGYCIAPETLVRAQREARANGLRVVGIVHSHPDHPAIPSPDDLAQAYWPECGYGIASVNGGRWICIAFFQFAEGPSPRRFVPLRYAIDPGTE